MFSWANKKKGTRQCRCRKCKSKNYFENAENISKKQKIWRGNNKEHLKKQKKRYYEKNKSEIAAKCKTYREEHKDYLSDYFKDYYKLNREYILNRRKQYRMNNKDKVNNINAGRRVRVLDQSPKLTDMEKKRIEFLYEISQLLGDGWKVDHYIPIAEGGAHHPDNLWIITTEDNLKKGAKLDYEIEHDMYFEL